MDTLYQLIINFNDELGTASYTRDETNGNIVYLKAAIVRNSKFIGWYNGSQRITDQLNYTYILNADTTLEARFQLYYKVTTHVVGNGSLDVTRFGENESSIVLNVIPDYGNRFSKYVINGLVTNHDLINEASDYVITNNDEHIIIRTSGNKEFYGTPLELTLYGDADITAHFYEVTSVHITTSTNIGYGSIYVSENDKRPGYQSVLWARPIPGYSFIRWQFDNSTENPRTITVHDDVTVTAIYQKTSEYEDVYKYRCFVKDQMRLTDPPKAFMMVKDFDVRTDLMTTANSTINVYKMDKSINEGDILVLYDPKGEFLYTGVINAIDQRQITCSQMQSFYKGAWIYEKGETPPNTFDNSWHFEKYNTAMSIAPKLEDFAGLTPNNVNTYNDNNISTSLNVGDSYIAKCTTYIWCSKPAVTVVGFQTDDLATIYLNGYELGTTTGANTEAKFRFDLVKGLNEVNVCYQEGGGSDGWIMYLVPDSFPAYSAELTYKVNDYVNRNNAIYRCTTAITTPEAWTAGHWTAVTRPKIVVLPSVLGLNSTKNENSYLETSIKNIVDYYASGHIVGSDYADPKIANRLSGITVQCVPTTLNNLTTADIGELMDFEDFIYMLYDKYGIIFDFEINFSGPNYVTIKVPSYELIKIGNNNYAITKMNPVTQVEETNRLIIFGSDKTSYRATWVATAEGTYDVTSNPGDRFNVTNTEIVFSDDPIGDIVAANLPNQMYNHQISFNLRLNNFIYEFDKFRLGGPLGIYYHEEKSDLNPNPQTEYYDSILTSYEISKTENKNIKEVSLICGKVRRKLTSLLTLGKV